MTFKKTKNSIIKKFFFAVTCILIAPISIGKNRVSVGWLQSYPSKHARLQLLRGDITPELGYHFASREGWLLSLKAHTKNLRLAESGDRLHLVVIGQSIQRKVRVYHPVYLRYGAEFFHVRPLSSISKGLEINPNIKAEMGASLSLGLEVSLTRDTSFLAFIKRWRGVNSHKLHGFDAGISVESIL